MRKDILDSSHQEGSGSWSLEWVAFILTVAFAVLLRWEAKDLIWGLWISSLMVGYAFIVRVIAVGVIKRPDVIPLPAALAGAAFMLAFFTFHFGMFHFVHSVFLSLFFPLLPKTDGFPDVPLLVVTALRCYWPVVLANLLVKSQDFRDVSFDLRKAGELMTKPYASVVRIHVLIFVFAGMSFLHVDRFAIYPILLFFFFPFETAFFRGEDGLRT